MILDVGASVHTISLLKKYYPNSFIAGINIKITPPNNLQEIFFGDGESMPFKSNSFDLIFIQETLEHIIYPNKFIEEAKRILKNGGDIIIDTPNLTSWSNRVLMLFGYPPTNYTPYPGKTLGVPKILGTLPQWDHPRVFPYRSVKALFSSNGFKLKKITGVNETAKGRRLRLLRIIVEKIIPSSWKDVIILKATIEK